MPLFGHHINPTQRVPNENPVFGPACELVNLVRFCTSPPVQPKSFALQIIGGEAHRKELACYAAASHVRNE